MSGKFLEPAPREAYFTAEDITDIFLLGQDDEEDM